MHDPLGLRTNITRHFGLTNSTVAIGYDDIGQLTSWSAKDPDNVTRFNEQLGWKYDAAGNLQQRTNNAFIQTFEVDNSDQLKTITRNNDFTVTGNTPGPASSVTVNSATAERYQDFTFARTNQTLASGANTFSIIAQRSTGGNVTNNVAVNLPDSVSLQYDLNGNLTSDGLRSFAYDAENQLTNVSVANAWKSEFVYDGFRRRRITKEYGWNGSGWDKTNEIRYVCDGMLAIQERDTNNNVSVAYTRGLSWGGGIGGMLARTDTNGSTFYHADGSGNITALMDERGDVVARYLYNPFGKQIGQWGALVEANRYRFSSKEISLNSGLYYYGFRFYEPNLQRWLNQDPIAELGGINLFGFAAADPVNQNDPLGLNNETRGLIMQNQPGIGAFSGPAGQGTQVIENFMLFPDSPDRAEVAGRVLQVAGAVGEAVVATGLLLAPEPTTLTKAGAGILYAKAADNLKAAFSENGKGFFQEGLEKFYGEDNPYIKYSMWTYQVGTLFLDVGAGLELSFPKFTVKPDKWRFFFNRDITPHPHNTARAIQNCEDLKAMGIVDDAAGRKKLMELFQQGLQNPEVSKHIGDYGTTITRTVQVAEKGFAKGSIDIKYFYQDGVVIPVPEISTIIPKIHK